MIEIEEQHARIRSIAAIRRDHASWAHVCTILDEIADDAVRARWAELEAELEGWPVEVRTAPARWATRLRAVGREPRVRLCRSLDLSFAEARDELWRALESDDTAQVTDLNVSYCALDPEAGPALAYRLVGRPVTSLRLKGNPLGAGIAAVFQLSRDGAVREVDATSCSISDDELAAVVDGGAAIGLRRLVLGINYLSARGVEQLARLPGVERLQDLSLDGNKLLAAGACVLAEQVPLRELRKLELGGTQCGDEGVIALSTTPTLARLESLGLRSCELGDVGAAALGATATWAELRILDLHYNHITAAGARAILAASGLDALAELRLDGNPLGDEIVDVLAGNARVARLASLWLDDQSLGEDARAAIRALPYAGIELLDLG